MKFYQSIYQYLLFQTQLLLAATQHKAVVDIFIIKQETTKSKNKSKSN